MLSTSTKYQNFLSRLNKFKLSRVDYVMITKLLELLDEKSFKVITVKSIADDNLVNMLPNNASKIISKLVELKIILKSEKKEGTSSLYKINPSLIVKIPSVRRPKRVCRG